MRVEGVDDLGRVIVTLSRSEWALAATEGCHRQIDGVLRGSKHKYGVTRDPYKQNINGAAAELAVATYFGYDWDGNRNRFNAKDAGKLEVRSTVRLDGVLTIYPKDTPSDWFVLVVGEAPTFRLAGMATGRYVIENGTAGSDRWTLPQRELRRVPMRHRGHTHVPAELL